MDGTKACGLSRREFFISLFSFLGGLMAYTLRTEDHAGELGRAADQNESVNNDIYFNTFGQWEAWVPVVTGYSADPSNTIYRYCRIGNLVILSMSEGANGTSDAATTNYSLPVNAKATANYAVTGTVPAIVDNGAGLADGVWYVGADAPTVVSVWKNGLSGWTASGAKRAFVYRVIIMYEAA